MKDMTMQELEETNGGFLFVVFQAVVTGLLLTAGNNIINNWDDFTAGVSGKPNPRGA